jgi:hypothetical protein
MSKFSPTLEALLNVAHSCPEPVSAAPNIHDIIERVEQEATARKLGRSVWLAVLTATMMTMASPASMIALFQYAAASEPLSERIAVAEFMREIGLRCLGINGVGIDADLDRSSVK